MVDVGFTLPDIVLENQNGEKVALSSLKGSIVVLYAYPKDDTSGCTTEACSFRDNYETIVGSDAIILGISPDSPSSHQKFIERHQLNFSLLSDIDHTLLETLGAWGEKSMYGRTYFGVIRSTFIFDKEGKLVKVWPKVKVKTHGEEVASFLQTL